MQRTLPRWGRLAPPAVSDVPRGKRLSGACSECERDVLPRRQVRRRARQVQDDATHRAHHLDAELEQPVAQPGHLRTGARGAGGAQPQFLHQHVGRGRQQYTQLVRREILATRAVDLQGLQFLDPVLDVAPRAVDLLVDEARRLPQVRDEWPKGLLPR